LEGFQNLIFLSYSHIYLDSWLSMIAVDFLRVRRSDRIFRRRATQVVALLTERSRRKTHLPMGKDYERSCASGEAFVFYAAMTRLMVRPRLARTR
jgi:hypothetical protein